MDALPRGIWPAAATGTVAIILFSWFFSVRAKRYHGIARFFVFETILLLTLLNAGAWFRDPFAPLQIVSWTLLTASFLLAAHSIFIYLKLSAPKGDFENSTRLVVRGVYRYIRHPMYESLGLFGLGVFFKRITALTAILAAVNLAGVYLTARIEEGEMRRRFGGEYEAYMRKTKMFVPFLFLFLAAFVSVASAQTGPLIRYTVAPEADGSRVTVEASFRLPSPPVYLKDFGQLEAVRWFHDGREIQIASERAGDLTLFKDLPASGEAWAVYVLACVTDPQPGYRKRLMGSPSFVMAREGLFLGISGREADPVELAWRLPPGWSLALGRDGVQRFSDTQRTLWVVGKTAAVSNLKFGGKAFRIAVLEGVTEARAVYASAILKKIFSYAMEKYGELDGDEFSVALFPRGSIGGGTAIERSLAGEDDLRIVIHEMLHWWTNLLAPAWFREGAHDYIALKVMVEQGALPPGSTKKAFDAYLQERLRVVKREGRVMSLAESSESYDSRKPAGDIYAFAPLFAAGLDREIRAHDSKTSLEQVFAAVCRMRMKTGERSGRPAKFNLPGLILGLTGYDPEGYFKRHFFVPVEDAGVVLK